MNQAAVDEMFRPDGSVRPPYRGISAALSAIDTNLLKTRLDALGRAYIDQGITFSLSGTERPFPLDPVPRVISASEWKGLEAGIAQRVRALEMFLDDVYGEQAILGDGIIPRRLINSCEHFHRQAAGIRPPNGVRIHVAGIDMIRDEHGDMRVLEDNVRSPSGVSYVIENRRTMARVFPDLFAAHRVRAVRDYPQHLLRALRVSHQHQRSDGGGADAGCGELGVLRAFAAGPPDGCGAGGGPRPVLPRQHRLSAHHRRRDPRRRHLPAHRRHVPRSTALPSGFDAGRRAR